MRITGWQSRTIVQRVTRRALQKTGLSQRTDDSVRATSCRWESFESLPLDRFVFMLWIQNPSAESPFDVSKEGVMKSLCFKHI